MSWSAAQLDWAFASAGLQPLQAAQYERFASYLELLLRWNARLNLTGIRMPEEMVARHFVECVFVAQRIDPDVRTLLDYGSGAGFPGIPIAICRPEIAVTLAESQAKKASFLREALRTLGVAGEVFAGRVEQMPGSGRFDAVAMRAVDRMPEAVPVAADRARQWLQLMTTTTAASELAGLASDYAWRPPVRLPGSHSAVLLVGQRAAGELIIGRRIG